MQFAKLRLVLPLIVCVLASSDAAEVQDTGQEGIFYGRGLVRAVEPGTGWLTIAHNDIMATRVEGTSSIEKGATSGVTSSATTGPSEPSAAREASSSVVSRSARMTARTREARPSDLPSPCLALNSILTRVVTPAGKPGRRNIAG